MTYPSTLSLGKEGQLLPGGVVAWGRLKVLIFCLGLVWGGGMEVMAVGGRMRRRGEVSGCR